MFRRDTPETVRRAGECFHVALPNLKTRAQYGHSVAEFCRWISDRGATSLRDIQPVHVAEYIGHRSKQVAAPTVKAELAALRSRFNYLTAGGVLPFNPAASVKGPRHSRAEGKTPGMTATEAGQLLASIRTDKVHPADRLKALRDKAVVSLMLYSACRVAAVCAALVEDFYQTGTDFNMDLHEKGGKDRVLVLHHKAAEAVHAWIEAAGIAGEPKTPLFRSMPNPLRRQARPFSERGMGTYDAWDMVKARCLAAGLSVRFSNHSFRVTALTNLLEKAAYSTTRGVWRAMPTPGRLRSMTGGAVTFPPKIWSNLKVSNGCLQETVNVHLLNQQRIGKFSRRRSQRIRSSPLSVRPKAARRSLMFVERSGLRSRSTIHGASWVTVDVSPTMS